MFSNLSIARKIALLMFALGLLLVVLMLNAFLRFRASEQNYLGLLGREESQLYLPRALDWLHDLERLLTLRIQTTDPKKGQALDLQLSPIRGAVLGELAGAQQRLPDKRAELAGIANQFDQVIHLAVHLRNLAAVGKTAEASRLYQEQFDPAVQGLRQRIFGLLGQARQQLIAETTRAQHQKRRVAEATLFASLAVLGGGLALAFFVVWRTISHPLAHSADLMTRLARRETNVIIPGTARGDEVGQIARGLVAFRDNLLQQQKLEQAQQRMLDRVQCSEQQFRSLVEAAPDACVITDANDRITLVNERAETLLGWPRAELVGQPHTLLFPERLRERQARDVRRLLETAAAPAGKTLELGLRRQDGSEFPAEVSVGPIADPDGGEPQVCVAIRDVTERRRAQQALADQLAFRAALLDTIPYPIFIKDADARFVGCNRAYEQAFNATRAALCGRTVLELEYLPLADRQRFHAEDVEVIARADRRSYELSIVFGSDGREHVTLYSVDGFRLADGRPGGLIGLLVDITDRQQAEAELRRSQQLLQSIMDNSNAIIYLKDPQGRYLMVNRQWVEFLGLPAGEALGHTDHELFLPETAARFVEVDEQVRKTCESVTAEEEAQVGGRRQVFLSQKFPLLDREGRLFATGGVSTDITRIKETQEELAAARDAADAANRAKSAFLATMSHEIRTPMNAILNMTSLALDTELTPRQRQYLSVTRSSARGLLALIDDILDFSKIEAGRLELDPAPFRLRALLEEVTDSFRGRVLERHVEFVVHVDPAVPDPLIGDSLRLRQVLINLVGNAFKFTEQGEVAVLVSLAELTPPAAPATEAQAVLRFDVHDTGIGIPADKLSQLFEAFSQADSSIARKFGGTGLGLAISRRLVNLMGGRISVESEAGHGSTFSFTARFGVPAGPARTEPVLPANLRDQHALVVEDNATSRELLVTLFRGFGLACEVAESAEAGWQLLIERNATAGHPQRFDLIVLDWLLPGADGLALARQIREHPALAALPIVMISCFAGKEEEAQARALGVNAFVPKPLTASLLLDAIMDAAGVRHVPLHGGVPEAVDPQEFTGRRVLLAEDNEANQFVAQELLERAGIAIDIAENGRVAIEKARLGKYDLVLMDVQMPELDGLAATRALRAEPGARRLPIIALTANALAADVQACLDAGMDDYVAKPIDRAHLFAVLRKWLPRLAPEPPVTPAAVPIAPDEPETAAAPAEPAPSETPAEVVEPALAAAAESDAPAPEPAPAAETEVSEPASNAAVETAPGVSPSPTAEPASPPAEPAAPTPAPEPTASGSSSAPKPARKPRGSGNHRQPKPPGGPEQQFLFAPPAPLSTETAGDSNLPRIEGVDVADALRRLGLPVASFLTMLGRFPAGARRELNDLREALEQGDAEAARRHAHSLAGAAGNLSVETVRRLAKTLELAIKSQTGNYETLYAELAGEAARVLAGLERIVANAARQREPVVEPPPAAPPGAKAQPAVDAASVALFLEELAAQLEGGDPDAADRLLAELAKTGLPAAAPDEFASLRQLVADFDFAAAAALARDLAKRVA